MAKTSRVKVPAVRAPRSPSATRRAAKSSTEQMPVDAVVIQLMSNLRQRLAAVVPSPEQRLAIAELRSYERAIGRWPAITPSERQRSAMLEQLLALEELAQAWPLAKQEPRPRSIKPPPAIDSSKTTKKLREVKAPAAKKEPAETRKLRKPSRGG